MKTETECAVVKDLEERQQDARTKKLRYLPSTALFAFFEGQEHAYRDMALQIRHGDYPPLKTEARG